MADFLDDQPDPQMHESESQYDADNVPDGAAGSVDDPPLLQFDGATLRLGAQAFGPFTLKVRAGERIAVLGCSGAGKSTLLRLLAGELQPSRGSAEFDGAPLVRRNGRALALRRAVLPQSTPVGFGLPVPLVVGLGRVVRDVDPDLARITTEALRMTRALHLRERSFDTLSGGEQARVQLARVFAQLWDVRGGLLLVDEPLAALDPGLQQELLDRMLAWAQQRQHAVVAILHDINQALAGFDRLWLVEQGRIAQDLHSSRAVVPHLERLYGLRLRCVSVVAGALAVVSLGRVAEPEPEPA